MCGYLNTRYRYTKKRYSYTTKVHLQLTFEVIHIQQQKGCLLHLLAAREWRLEVVRMQIFAGDHMLESHGTTALNRLSSFARHGPIPLLHLHYERVFRVQQKYA